MSTHSLRGLEDCQRVPLHFLARVGTIYPGVLTKLLSESTFSFTGARWLSTHSLRGLEDCLGATFHFLAQCIGTRSLGGLNKLLSESTFSFYRCTVAEHV